mgnify:CR=1 FL=1
MKIDELLKKCENCKLNECIQCEYSYNDIKQIVEEYNNLEKKNREMMEVIGLVDKLMSNNILRKKIKNKILGYQELADECYIKFLESNKTDREIRDKGIAYEAKIAALKELREEIYE